MLRFLAVSCLVLLVAACTPPDPTKGKYLFDDVQKQPNYKQQIAQNLRWLAPEEKWHYNCLFLKPIKELNLQELKMAAVNSEILFRAHAEEERTAYQYAGMLYRKAADQGVAYGLAKLGQLLIEGKGAEQNPEGAMKLLEQSALLDCAIGQTVYAEHLTTGKVVRSDLITAWSWAEMAREQGYMKAEELQKKMQSVMSSSQIALAQYKAKELRSQIDRFNDNAKSEDLVRCVTERNHKPFIVRMRACHAMGGTHIGPAF